MPVGGEELLGGDDRRVHPRLRPDPAGARGTTTVVAATGTGYQGVHTDERTKATVATWKLPRSAPKDSERMTITLSKPGTATDNLRGNIRWAKPAPKDGPSADVVNIAPAPL